MASLLETLAENLAKDAMEQAAATGDEDLVDAIAKNLADTSTTFQETYLTCIRYLRAEARARAMLPGVQSGRVLPAPEEAPGPAASRPTPVEEETTEPDDAVSDPVETPSLDDEEIPYAEAEIVEDDEEDNPFAQPSGHVGTGRLVPKPKISSADAENPTVEPEVTGPRKAGR